MSERYVSCLENRTHKVVKVCMNGIVAVVSAVYIVPYMRYSVLGEALMIAVRR